MARETGALPLQCPSTPGFRQVASGRDRGPFQSRFWLPFTLSAIPARDDYRHPRGSRALAAERLENPESVARPPHIKAGER